MNSGNASVPAKDSSPETALGDLKPQKSELDISKQSEPSTSTIPIKSPKQNVIKGQSEEQSGKQLVESMEFTYKYLEPFNCDQSKKKSRLLDIKVTCETLSEELKGRILSDKYVIDTLNSLIASNEHDPDKQKTISELSDLEKTIDKLTNNVHQKYSGDKYVVDTLEKLLAISEEFIAGKRVIESLCVEIRVLLDAMLRPVTTED